eukprot:5859633-Alexandrium_andersonii.AAC.1
MIPKEDPPPAQAPPAPPLARSAALVAHLSLPESLRRVGRMGKTAADKEWARRQWHAVCTNPFWVRRTALTRTACSTGPPLPLGRSARHSS